MKALVKYLFTATLTLWVGSILKAQTAQPYRNEAAPVAARVNSLLQTLTLDEKIAMLGYVSPGVQRLNIPAYNWWNEGLHGVARAGEATVFPQAIGMAATFNDALLHEVAAAISTEARAKYNLSVAQNRHLWYMGLTFWSPNINIFRDPRWGRGQETYGEDPFLTAKMGTAYVQGMQGSNDRYLKVAACAKHFAVHSGPEAGRHSFNTIVGEKDLRETYLYAFQKLTNAGVASVMCAYNRVNGEPCCTSETLLQNILRNEWNYKGQLVTDCGALNDIIDGHKMYNDKAQLAAAAIKAGINLECGSLLQSDVQAALDKKLLRPEDVDNALRENLQTQVKLGFYDSAATNPYSGYGADSIDNGYHRRLALQMAEESMVLLKNNGVLPLQKDAYSSIMVAGANAASNEVLFGNYHGVNSNMLTFVEGISKAAGPATAVNYDQGSDYTDTTRFGGIWAAGNSDVTIAVIGLTPVLEGEEGDAFLSLSGGDKTTLSLPGAHIAFLKKLKEGTKTPIIAVVTAGSDVDIAAIAQYADAVILAWYPGEEGGTALANLLFGKASPSGRLPITFYRSLTDLPPYDNYNMEGRTYRYFTRPVQYPFGYGLSYTQFDYTWKQPPLATYTAQDTVQLTVQVHNSGSMDGNEVVQVYVEYPNIKGMPVKELKAFKKVRITKGATADVTLQIPMSELQKWNAQQHRWQLYKGTYALAVAKNADEYILQKSFVVK